MSNALQCFTEKGFIRVGFHGVFREVFREGVPGRCSGGVVIIGKRGAVDVFHEGVPQSQSICLDTWCSTECSGKCSGEGFREVFRGGVPEVWLSLANVVQGGCSTEVFREMFHGGVPRICF